MRELFTTQVGRLRIIGMLEGVSLLALLGIGMPAKYYFGSAEGTRVLGTVHGALFLLFVFNALSAGVAQRWKFRETTWKVLLACMVPFGTFYVDRKILSGEMKNRTTQR